MTSSASFHTSRPLSAFFCRYTGLFAFTPPACSAGAPVEEVVDGCASEKRLFLPSPLSVASERIEREGEKEAVGRSRALYGRRRRGRRMASEAVRIMAAERRDAKIAEEKWHPAAPFT